MAQTKYLPLAVANEFIHRAGHAGVSHMKLQKLVYMAHERWLRDHDEPFLDEEPQVWQYGPVFSWLYHNLKHHRAAPIKEMQDLFDTAPRVEDAEVLRVIDEIWRRYKDTKATELSDITHRPGTPWHKIASGHKFNVPIGTTIPTKAVKEYVRSDA